MNYVCIRKKGHNIEALGTFYGLSGFQHAAIHAYFNVIIHAYLCELLGDASRSLSGLASKFLFREDPAHLKELLEARAELGVIFFNILFSQRVVNGIAQFPDVQVRAVTRGSRTAGLNRWVRVAPP